MFTGKTGIFEDMREHDELAGAPASCLVNALYEIEDEMEKTNVRLKDLIKQREK